MTSLRLTFLALACACAPLLAETVPAASMPTATRPVPIKVVYPTNLGPAYANETVLIRFRLDRAGVPHDVTPASRMPEDLANRLVLAVSQWRFKPCQDIHGVAVERSVVLPLELSDHTLDGTQRLALGK